MKFLTLLKIIGGGMKFNQLFTIVIISSLLFSITVLSQNRVQTIDEYLTSLHKAGRFNGSVLVAEKDGTTSAIETYKSLKQNNKNDYDFGSIDGILTN